MNGAASEARTFHRNLSIRLVTGSSALLFGAVAISVGAGSGLTSGFFVLLGLSVLGLTGAITAWGDRYTLGPAGITYRNRILELMGTRERLVAWGDIAQVREHRSLRFGRAEGFPTAVFLVLRSGRRVVLDSLHDFDEALEIIRRHHGAGEISTPPAYRPR